MSTEVKISPSVSTQDKPEHASNGVQPQGGGNEVRIFGGDLNPQTTEVKTGAPGAVVKVLPPESK